MINHTVTVIALVANGRFKQPNKWLQLVNAASIDAEQSTAAGAGSSSAMSDARRRHEELHAQAEHVRAS